MRMTGTRWGVHGESRTALRVFERSIAGIVAVLVENIAGGHAAEDEADSGGPEVTATASETRFMVLEDITLRRRSKTRPPQRGRTMFKVHPRGLHECAEDETPPKLRESRWFRADVIRATVPARHVCKTDLRVLPVC